MATGKTILITVDRFIGRLFLILAALFVGMAVLALPPEGFFFALPFLLFMVAVVLGIIGSLFYLAVRGLKRDAQWQWIAQVVPILIILCIVLLSLTL
jgi:phosphoglycerol transferase MdoB-like AlkP superfamily enzyme